MAACRDYHATRAPCSSTGLARPRPGGLGRALGPCRSVGAHLLAQGRGGQPLCKHYPWQPAESSSQRDLPSKVILWDSGRCGCCNLPSKAVPRRSGESTGAMKGGESSSEHRGRGGVLEASSLHKAEEKNCCFPRARALAAGRAGGAACPAGPYPGGPGRARGPWRSMVFHHLASKDTPFPPT